MERWTTGGRRGGWVAGGEERKGQRYGRWIGEEDRRREIKSGLERDRGSRGSRNGGHV